MLTIRKEQMNVLSAYMGQAFEERIIRHIRQNFPDQYKQLGDTDAREDNLRKLIRQGIERARRYGIESERDAARFVELMIRIGPTFEELPEYAWAKAVLSDPNISGHGRVELIHQQLESRTASANAARQIRNNR
jgi:hypothetical protein